MKTDKPCTSVSALHKNGYAILGFCKRQYTKKVIKDLQQQHNAKDCPMYAFRINNASEDGMDFAVVTKHENLLKYFSEYK